MTKSADEQAREAERAKQFAEHQKRMLAPTPNGRSIADAVREHERSVEARKRSR